MAEAVYPALSGGPCTPWITLDDYLDAHPETPLDSGGNPPAFLQAAIDAAIGVLWALSARQFSGDCLAFVRPCRVGCGCWPAGEGIVGGAGGGFSWTGGVAGWGWWGDRCDVGCGCGSISVVKLAGYPVTEIVEVKIGATVVPSTEYRLDRMRELVRLDDADGNEQRWPRCQNLWDDPGEQGTWSVTYKYGSPPPAAGVLAALELAEQFWLAASNPGACRLPTGVTKVTRQGITIERLLPMFAKDQRTGLVLTDAFLATYNPAGLRRRPTVRSPGYPRFPRRTPHP